MVSGDDEQSLVHSFLISSVGPGCSIGSDSAYHLSGLDLAMKLHYIHGIYFFDSEASRSLTVTQIKSATFVLFNEYYVTCGRLRQSDSGRPFIKCNDCGARFIEAECRMTVAEWLQTTGDDWSSLKLLVPQKVIGPELQFSPLIYMQVTRFKCKGISIGLSWSHILSDAFSASAFMNALTDLLFGAAPSTVTPPPPLGVDTISNFSSPKPPLSAAAKPPLSLRRVDPVGDHWIPTNNCKMESFSFELNATQLAKLQTQMPHQTPPFESISAVLWQSIAKLRRGSEPTTVTLCKHNPIKQKGKITRNAQKISTVKFTTAISAADWRELAELLVDSAAEEESKLIEEAVERDDGVSDFVVYGANLTFVKWDEADLYGDGMETNFERPKFVYYTVHGVGDSGVVVVVPGPGDDSSGQGRLVTVILPENEVVGLKAELKANGMFL